MLKHTILCVMLVAAAAMGWGQQQSSLVPVEVGTHLTWGNGLVWGIFPVNGGGNGPTCVATWDPTADHDSAWDDSSITNMSSARLVHTSLTFQWKEQPVLFGIGNDGSLDRLYWYFQNAAQWGSGIIDTFAFGAGASIAYVPNDGYDVWDYAVPGWIYCFPGNTTSFWRYAVPAGLYPDISLYGYYPGPGSTISDQTPPFEWSSAATNQYRIQVSTNPNFMSNVIDEVVSTPEYEPTTRLANGTYYWRTAAWIGGGWSWCSSTRSFVLQGGWVSRPSIPHAGGDGSIIAYASSFGTNGKSILALVNGTSHDYFYRYNISDSTWYAEDTPPGSVNIGTSLTTSAPFQGAFPHIMAVFSGQVKHDNPWYYDVNQQPRQRWLQWNDDSGDTMFYSHLPQTIGTATSMVLGPDNMTYLLPGLMGSDNFYDVEPPDTLTPEGHRGHHRHDRDDGGQQAGIAQNGKAVAHAVAGCHGVEVEYQLPVSARVRATLRDAIGRQVGALDVGDQKPGVHRLEWNRDREGRQLNAGAYFVLLDMGTEQARLKTVVK